MKSVLISIKPKWCELIAQGKKTVEVRKTKPKIDVPFKVYIYCTQPQNKFDYLNLNPFGYDLEEKPISELSVNGNGKVIGEFLCKCNRTYCTGCKDFYDEGETVFRMCGGLKAVTRPPQSWCYVEELGV